MIKTLRRCIGSEQGFQYKVITFNLQAKGFIEEVEGLIPCSEIYTSIRRLEENGNYEALVDGKWTRIGEDTFAKTLLRHRYSHIIRRRAGNIVKKSFTYADILKFEDHYHFVDQLKLRFMDNPTGITHILNYVFKAGRVIPSEYLTEVRHDEIPGKTLIYEKDMDMLIICTKCVKGILHPRTTYSPNNPWFNWLVYNMEQNGTKLSDLQTLEAYTKETLGEYKELEL